MGNPFDDYKDKVNYDYIIEAKMKYKFKGGNEEQKLDATDKIIENIEKLISDEDYNKMYFDDVELGRVYPRLDEIDDTLDMTFGICITEESANVTLQNLKDDIEEYMFVLDSNIDGVTVYGWENGDEDVDVATVYLKTSRDIEINVLKQPENKDTKKESKQLKTEEVDIGVIDKTLVQFGNLVFKNPETGDTIEYVLNDDGKIEIYLNSELVNTLPFSKVSIQKECKLQLEKGCKLQEAQIKTSDGQTVDTEKEKERLEQVDKEVSEIAQMKQDIEDKVNQIVEEDKEVKTEYAKNTKYYRIQRGKETEVSQGMLIGKLQTLKTDIKLGITLRNDYTIDDIDDMIEKVNQGQSVKLFDAWYLNEEDYNGNKFESTEYTSKKLSLNEIKQKPIKECLTPAQQDYIIIVAGDLDEFLKGFENMYTEVPVQDDDELLSIDEYVDYLLGGNQ